MTAVAVGSGEAAVFYLPDPTDRPEQRSTFWRCVRTQPSADEQAAALYFESDLELVEDLLEGQQWVASDLYQVQLRCGDAPRALRFVVTLASGARFELALEALDGEPLTSGAFASSDSSFRINRLDWDDGGELLALDADFEALGIGDEPVFGRIIWNTSWDPEEPPFVGLTDEEYELGYWGQATLTECDTPNGAAITAHSCRGTPSDNVRFQLSGPEVTQVDDPDALRLMGTSSVDLDDVKALELSSSGTRDPTSSRAGDRAESSRHNELAVVAGTRVDSIRYSKEPAQSPSDARRMIEQEVAQLDQTRSFAESVVLREDPQAPDPALSRASAIRANPSQAYFAGWPEPARGELYGWQDFDEIAVERVSETEPETEAETNSLTETESVANTKDSLPNSSDDEPQAALERAASERFANDEPAGALTALVEPIQRGASAANPSATPPLDHRTALETLLRHWMVASSVAMTELLERAIAFWLEMSS